MYIDGQNFHHGLTYIRELKDIDSRYINFKEIGELLTKPKNNDLRAVKYYGAKYPAKVDQAKHYRDAAFFKLMTDSGIIVVEGHFKIDQNNVPREKGVDVRLAVDLLTDAWYGLYDQAYVISNDSDLVPAVARVKELHPNKKIFSVFFKDQLFDFKNTCDGHIKLYPNKIKKCYHPETFTPSSDMLSHFAKSMNQKHNK